MHMSTVRSMSRDERETVSERYVCNDCAILLEVVVGFR